ncbi:hypothetical protein ACOSQ2_013461 [Xanthoceras sorbifolium]
MFASVKAPNHTYTMHSAGKQPGHENAFGSICVPLWHEISAIGQRISPTITNTGFKIFIFKNSARRLYFSPTTPFSQFRLLPFRSPLLRESLLLSFPLATKMFQFARLSLACPWIQQQFERLTYSGISGSTLILKCSLNDSNLYKPNESGDTFE